MKSYSVRLIIAIITFVIGTLAVASWYFITHKNQSQKTVVACPPKLIEKPAPRVLLPIHKDNKYGFIDETGRVVITPRFDHAQRFSEGLAAVMVGGQVGYIDQQGNYVIKPQFAGCCEHNFSEGLAAVKLDNSDNKWSYIDKTGKVVFQIKADYVDSFSEGLAATITNKRWRYIDKQGSVVLDLPYRTPDYFPMRFGNGLARVKIGQKWGYIDQQGKVAIAAKFDNASNFSEGLAAVKLGKKWGYIDSTGEMVLQPDYDVIGDFSNGLASVSSDKKTGYIDRSGRLVIPAEFVMSGEFRDGFASATLGRVEVHNGRCCGMLQIFGKSGFIDKQGRLIWYFDRETRQYSR